MINKKDDVFGLIDCMVDLDTLIFDSGGKFLFYWYIFFVCGLFYYI